MKKSNNKIMLNGHILKKGIFITPLHDAMGDKLSVQSWTQERMPKFLWLGVILDRYDREEGLQKIQSILNKLFEINEKLTIPNLSDIFQMEGTQQAEFYEFILSITEKDILAPLAIIYAYSEYPIFSKYFCQTQISYEKRRKSLLEILEKCYNYKSNFSTDICFCVGYYTIITGKYHPLAEKLEAYKKYPHLSHSDGEMNKIRPGMRLDEMMYQMMAPDNNNFCKSFWKKVSKMTDCNLFGLKHKKEESKGKEYIEIVRLIFEYLTKLFKATNPLDKKTAVILGISVYAYKRLIELVEHDLFHTITARSTIRVMIENYIMLKFLLKKEVEDSNIWQSFQEYGLGCFKKVVAHSKEMSPSEFSHVDYIYLNALVNEHTDDNLLNINTTYFKDENIRAKAELVEEKELWGLYYEYDTSYEHGFWGAIRESSMLACKNPAHQFHCLPDYENAQNLRSVWYDSVMIMNKILKIVNNVFDIPGNLMEEANNIEREILKNSFEPSSK